MSLKNNQFKESYLFLQEPRLLIQQVNFEHALLVKKLERLKTSSNCYIQDYFHKNFFNQKKSIFERSIKKIEKNHPLIKTFGKL